MKETHCRFEGTRGRKQFRARQDQRTKKKRRMRESCSSPGINRLGLTYSAGSSGRQPGGRCLGNPETQTITGNLLFSSTNRKPQNRPIFRPIKACCVLAALAASVFRFFRHSAILGGNRLLHWRNLVFPLNEVWVLLELFCSAPIKAGNWNGKSLQVKRKVFRAKISLGVKSIHDKNLARLAGLGNFYP